MKKSASITSAILLHFLLYTAYAAVEKQVVTKVEEELHDLDIINEDDNNENVVSSNNNGHEDANTAEKGHPPQDVKGDTSLMSRQSQINNILQFNNYLNRILVQNNITFPQFKFHRKRRKSVPVEKEEEAVEQQPKRDGQQQSILYNEVEHSDVETVKDISNNNNVGSGRFQVENARWVRAWCLPNSSKTRGSNSGKSVEVVANSGRIAPPTAYERNNEIDDNLDDDEENDNVQSGMVLFVESSSITSGDDGSSSSSSNSDNDGGEENALSSSEAACLTVLGQQYDHNEEIIQYVLLEQELYLGNIDVHKRDFAYYPVVARLEENKQPEEETSAVVEAFGSRYGHPSRGGQDQSGDRQLSFRWWSWVAHLSQIIQMFHNNKRDNYNKQHSTYQSSIYEEVGKSAFAGGSHGEVWRARRRCPSETTAAADKEEEERNSTESTPTSFSCDDGKDLIVKRLKIELGYPVLEAGLREVYFGELLAREVESSTLFTTYVDHFFREGKRGQAELWIVFENAGPSLRSYMYETTVADGFVIFQHSAFWRRLRMGISRSRSHKREDDDLPNKEGKNDKDSNGGQLLKEVLKQILQSVAFLHDRGITHRDIKPSNILCKTNPSSPEDIILDTVLEVNCVLADFSSGYDEFVDRNLYGNGPSANEQTDEYAPPEVLLQGPSLWEPFSSANPYSYDSWSIGVLALELLLGTPNVFSVDQRTTALLTNKLQNEGASSSEIKKALYLAALSQFCIYVPTNGMNWPLRKGDPLNDINVAKNSCTLHDFHNALRARDPLGLGFESSADLLLHLIWRLLDWDPLTRITPVEALTHPYFTQNYNHSDHKDMDSQSPPVEKLLFRRPLNDFMIPGSHNALEHQTLDPRVDMNSSDTVSDFVCPKCGKKFSDHNSCQMHARSRKHALFCTYDVTLLPQCINTHSMLPTHSTSGYCDIQGRRRTIEDFHTIHLNDNHQFYGIFDGHMGNLASKFSASSFYNVVRESLSTVDKEIKSSNSTRKWKEKVHLSMEQSFYNLHEGILQAIDSSPSDVMRDAGTTATILHVTELAVIVANVGDSRAVLSSYATVGNKEEVIGIPLTVDHVASCPSEQNEVIERGGFISKSGGIDRVNGSLAVSRSLGDVKLAPFLSQIPHVSAFTKDEVRNQCGGGRSNKDVSCFIIVASDGLWDVVGNNEAVEFVTQVLQEKEASYQTAAQLLTQEAYVRGSSDNIGVLIVAILND